MRIYRLFLCSICRLKPKPTVCQEKKKGDP